MDLQNASFVATRKQLIIYFFSMSCGCLLLEFGMMYFSISKVPCSVEELCTWMPSFKGKQRSYVAIGVASFCSSIWKTRDQSYFQGVLLKDPTVVIFSICHWLMSGMENGLQNDADQNKLKNGTLMLSRTTSEVINARYRWRPTVSRIGVGQFGSSHV